MIGRSMQTARNLTLTVIDGLACPLCHSISPSPSTALWCTPYMVSWILKYWSVASPQQTLYTIMKIQTDQSYSACGEKEETPYRFCEDVPKCWPEIQFLRASAMLKHVIAIGLTSVRPSVRPSHAGTLSKRLNILSWFLHHTIAHSF